MNKIILKIEFINTKAFFMTFLYVDKRLLSKGLNDIVHFYNSECDFIIYSSKNIKQGDNFLRLPDRDKYEKNVPHRFNFLCESEMYVWLKLFHRTLDELNNKYTPFVKDPNFDKRSDKVMLSGEYWIV